MRLFTTLKKKMRNISTLARGLLLLVIGLVFLVADIVCGLYWKDATSEVPRLFVTSVLSTLSSVFIVSAVWEWFCKIAFAKQIQLNVQMAEDVIDSGIIGIYNKFEDIRWRAELRNVSNFTVFLKFGRTWLKEHATIFQEYLYGFQENSAHKKAINKMTIVLPNYSKNDVLKTLLYLYPKSNSGKERTIDDIKKYIEESIVICREIDPNIKIKLYNGVPETSYYKMDNTILMVPYPHDRSERRLPAIKLSNGSLYDFCNNDFKKIIANSEELLSNKTKLKD